MPDSIANEPQLEFGWQLYYTAFNELTHSRNVGMAMGAIPWEVVQKYATEYLGLKKYELYLFHYLLSQMDAVYLLHHSGKKTEDDNS